VLNGRARVRLGLYALRGCFLRDHSEEAASKSRIPRLIGSTSETRSGTNDNGLVIERHMRLAAVDGEKGRNSVK
jgi:hypothetical protein